VSESKEPWFTFRKFPFLFVAEVLERQVERGMSAPPWKGYPDSSSNSEELGAPIPLLAPLHYDESTEGENGE
jgi:hypothetical protein